METITFNQVKDIQKNDRIKITYINKSGELITKTTRFYGVDGNFILVYVPRKQKQLWEIPINSECIIKKIGA